MQLRDARIEARRGVRQRVQPGLRGVELTGQVRSLGVQDVLLLLDALQLAERDGPGLVELDDLVLQLLLLAAPTRRLRGREHRHLEEGGGEKRGEAKAEPHEVAHHKTTPITISTGAPKGRPERRRRPSLAASPASPDDPGRRGPEGEGTRAGLDRLPLRHRAWTRRVIPAWDARSASGRGRER